MSQTGSSHQPKSKVNQSRVAGSQYSVNQQMRKNRATLKEEMIAKKITEIFKEKEQKMIRTIEVTIVEDRLRIYKQKRAEFEEELNELEQDRKRIIKRKKNKKERMKLLKANTKQQFFFIAKALNATVIYYKQYYFENDYYRFKKLLDVQQATEGEPPMDEKAKQRALLEQLNNFFNSPFKEDRRFTIYHMAQLTRDRLESSTKLVNALFFDKIFQIILKNTDEKNKLKAFEILCNLIQSQTHRKKLAREGYFRQVYEAIQVGKVDEKKEERTLEKLSWMTTLICFHPDMIDQIVSLKLLKFIISLVQSQFSASIRSNAVLAISLLTYHEQLFNELISNGVIDIVMDLCMDQNQDIQVKQFSTLALVHFALSKQSINILIEKGIMDLFNSLGLIDNVQIQTNVSWIFLALCNNGITGKQMLTNGITRDMFLVSCNPQFHQIRHLVIAGFAELGRCTELAESQLNNKNGSLQRIKEKAIVGMHDAFRLHATETIDILLRFTISSELKFMETAFWALKDYILLNHDHLIQDLSGIICAFVNGSAEHSVNVKTECANAISFLITHQLVFHKKEAEERKLTRDPNQQAHEYNPKQNYVLDSLMLLSGSDSLQVRTRAFSTLSTLSTYASQSEDVMPLIQQDITIPPDQVSRQYYDFIQQRIAASRANFVTRYMTEDIERKFAGLYCLLRLGQSPEGCVAIEAALYLHSFFYPEHYQENDFEKVFSHHTEKFNEPLTNEEKTQLSVNLGKDECDERKIELNPLNEKYFMFVFQALLYSRNVRIMYLLLDVVNFYIKHETDHQKEVINAATILWMLQILDRNSQDRDLCLLVAKSVLRIVDNHQILFDYQEMAIIKKFNRALENLNLDPNEQVCATSDEEEYSDDQALSENQSKSNGMIDSASRQKLIEEARRQLELDLKQGFQLNLDLREFSYQANSLDQSIEVADKMFQTEISSEKQLEQSQEQRSKQVNISNDLTSQNEKSQTDYPIQHSQASISAKSVGKSEQPYKDGVFIFKVLEQLQLKDDLNLDEEESLSEIRIEDPESRSEKQVQIGVKQLDMQNLVNQSEKSFKNSEKELTAVEYQSIKSSLHTKQTSQNIQSIPNEEGLPGLGLPEQLHTTNQSLKKNSVDSMKVSEKQNSVSENKRYKMKKSSLSKTLGDQSVQSQTGQIILQTGRSFIPPSHQSEHQKQNNELRDALIKSFMVIFTNEKSQHLLLNQDIIDIAFNCLEYCEQISIDAKRNLARLISIIFKFPQVQDRILQEKIVEGITHLLKQDISHSGIITHALRSCTYIALSYNFVNSPLSLPVLQALTPLMEKLETQQDRTFSSDASKDHQKPSKVNNSAETMSDKDNCLFSIANILKGSSVNAQYFIRSDGPRKVMQELLRLTKEQTISNEKMEVVELCVSSIKQLANTKQTFKEFLEFSALNRELLTQCMLRVFEISDNWFKCSKELTKFNTVFRSQENLEKPKTVRKIDTDTILKLDQSNIEELKAAELQEQQQELSIRMASIVKIRNNIYYTVVGCFKSTFQVDFLLQNCSLVKRMIEDLRRDNLNDYIFQHLILCLQGFQKNVKAMEALIQTQHNTLFELVANIEHMDKKIIFIKSIIQISLRIPEWICDKYPKFFVKLFTLTSTLESNDPKQNSYIEDITENVLWLQTTLLELNLSESQTEKAIQMSMDNKTAQVFVQNLKSQNERIVLQALKGLAIMASIPDFRPTLLIDQAEKLFVSIAEIINSNIRNFKLYQLEIETSIVTMLAQITSAPSGASKDPLTVAARRRAVQQGFLESFLKKCSKIEYQLIEDTDNLDIQDFSDEDASPIRIQNQHQIALSKNLSEGLPNKNNSQGPNLGSEYDDIEKLDSQNKFIEDTFMLASNATELTENHYALVKPSSLMLPLLLKISHLYLEASAKNLSDGPISLLDYDYGNLQMAKYISSIFMNLVSRHSDGRTDIQELCVKNGFGQLMVRLCQSLEDYDVQTCLNQGLVELVLSQNASVQTAAVEQGCLNHISKEQEESQFHKVRRITSAAMDNVPQTLIDLNAKSMKKKLF